MGEGECRRVETRVCVWDAEEYSKCVLTLGNLNRARVRLTPKALFIWLVWSLILLNIFLRNENTITQNCIVHQSGGLKPFLVWQHSTREMWNDDLQMTWVLPDRKRLPYYTLCIPMLQQLNVGLTLVSSQFQ